MTYSHDGGGENIETVGPMERKILEAASANDGELSRASISKLVRGTKWQYASAATDPVRALEARGWNGSTQSIIGSLVSMGVAPGDRGLPTAEPEEIFRDGLNIYAYVGAIRSRSTTRSG